MTAISLSPPYDKPPLSLNKRLHWAKERVVKENLKTLVWLRCRDMPPAEKVTVWLRWQPQVKRRRDGDNPMPTVKPCVDALVKAGVIPDDTTEHVEHAPLELLPVDPTRPARLWFMVETVA